MIDKNSFLDIVLLPKSLHKRITGKISTLALGVVLVGICDILINTDKIRSKLIEDSHMIVWNLIIALLFIVVTGVLDVFCFGYPIADLCKYIFKKREIEFSENIHILIMKAYALSHLILLPIRIFIVWIEPYMEGGTQVFWIKAAIFFVFIYIMVEPLWWSGIIVRSVSSKVKLTYAPKAIIFIVVMIWNQFIAFSFQYLFQHIYSLYDIISK